MSDARRSPIVAGARTVVRWVTTRSAALRRRPRPGTEQPSLPSLTDRELRSAWEATAAELRRRPDARRRLALVITRQHLLDEIWSRDRAALEAWVARGASSRPREPYPDP